MTSCRVTRPSMPVPRTRARSISCSSARRRTTGEYRRMRRVAADAPFGCGAGARVSTAGDGDDPCVAAAATRAASGTASAVLPSAPPTRCAAGSPENSARGAPMGTVSPSCTRMFSSLPANGLGISTTALSVSTSTTGSSSATSSPAAFSQQVTVPSVTPSPTFGIVKCGILAPQYAASSRMAAAIFSRDGRQNSSCASANGIAGTSGDGEPADRRIERVECVLGDDGGRPRRRGRRSGCPRAR